MITNPQQLKASPRPVSNNELLALADSMHKRLSRRPGPWFINDLAKGVQFESENLRNTLKHYRYGVYNIREVLTSRKNLMACMKAVKTYGRALPKQYAF